MSAEAESVSPALNLDKCSVVLLDVAGTTSSINFVKDTLFPYVTRKAEEFLKLHWEDANVKESVKALKDSELEVADAIAAVKELTEQNSDNKGLKAIQGLIYKEGYESGILKAHVFSDVPTSLDTWAKSRKVAIYSTGSIESQKLLFSHTAEGDVSSHISNYFDQSIGSKTDAESYKKISKELGVECGEILFISDIVEEVKAAKSSGLLTLLIKREGNEAIPEDASKEYTVISSFKDVTFENPAKRKNEDETVPVEEQPPSKVAKTDVTDEEQVVTEIATKDTTAEEKVEEESMEVDTPVENETAKSEAKSENVSDKPIENKKTEMDSTDKKTDEKSDTLDKETQSRETVAEDVPMETSDNIEENKVGENEQIEIKEAEQKVAEEVKSKPETATEANVQGDNDKNVEDINKLGQNEKIETEIHSTETPCNKEPDIKENITNKTEEETKNNVDEKVINTEEQAIASVAEQKVSTTEEVMVSNKEQNKKNDTETADKKDAEHTIETVTNETKQIEPEEKDPVEKQKDVASEEKTEVKESNTEPVVEKVEEIISKTSVKEDNVKEQHVEESKPKESAIVETVSKESDAEVKDNTCEQTTSNNKQQIEENVDEKMDSDDSSPKVENTKEPVDKKVESHDSCPKEVQKGSEEKSNSNEPCTAKDQADECKVEQVSKDTDNIDEKENKSELANGIEKGEVNGDTEEKQTGDATVDDSENKIEEIKVKKIEESEASTPPVSVEV